jgi:hypothetical protein
LPTTSSNVHANAFAEDVIINRKLALEFEENDKWATYCSREDLTVPTGLEAFVVTGVEGNSITTEEIEFIPKETPILIQRTDQEPPFWGRSTNQTLPDGLVLDKQFKGTITGISNITKESHQTIEVYTLDGRKVDNTTDNLKQGVYVVRKGQQAQKMIIK